MIVDIFCIEIFFVVCNDRSPLGMSIGQIKTQQLNVSSMWSKPFGRSQSRLHIQGGWCSKRGTSQGNFKKEWFEVYTVSYDFCTFCLPMH